MTDNRKMAWRNSPPEKAGLPPEGGMMTDFVTGHPGKEAEDERVRQEDASQRKIIEPEIEAGFPAVGDACEAFRKKNTGSGP